MKTVSTAQIQTLKPNIKIIAEYEYPEYDLYYSTCRVNPAIFERLSEEEKCKVRRAISRLYKRLIKRPSSIAVGETVEIDGIKFILLQHKIKVKGRFDEVHVLYIHVHIPEK